MYCIIFANASSLIPTFATKPYVLFLWIMIGKGFVWQLIVGVGMGPLLAIKYFRYTYTPSKINTLQQAERLGGPILSLKNIEHQPRPIEKEVSPISITQPKNRNTVYEPLLSDSPTATRRSLASSSSSFDFFQTPPSSYSRNKDN